MPLQLQDVGAIQMLKSYLAKTQPAGGNTLTLKLYVNNVTPSTSGADTAAVYTEAGAGHGYTAATLAATEDGTHWVISTVGNIAQAAYAKQTFTWTSDPTETVYGYFVVDADGVLIWAERAAATFTPTANGDYYEVTPVFKLSGGTPA